jgi:IPT/TIG domain
VPNSATPTDPTVFYGGGDLWRTTNPSAESPTWTKVTSVGQYVSAIAVSATQPNVVYVGFTSGVIQLSTDGGVTFASIGPEPTAEQFVTGLSVNPSDPKEIAASFSFNDTRYAPGFPHAALYSYTKAPGSGTWSVITGNLPEVAVSRVVYDNGALVAATDQGVYGTGVPAGSSTTWTRVGTEMPNVQVQDLDVERDGLYAITHGRGAWKLPLPPASPTVTNVSPNRGPAGGGTTVTITGTNLTGATAIKFGSTSATSFTVNSATSITAVSPAETAGRVDVAVTTRAGTSAISSKDRFRFRGHPHTP